MESFSLKKIKDITFLLLAMPFFFKISFEENNNLVI